jgi:hypothetical protein
MSKNEDLKYVCLEKGVPVTVSYNANYIKDARKTGKTDKAHLLPLEKQRKKKKLKQAITFTKVVAGMTVLVVLIGALGVSWVNYIDTTSSVGREIKHEYVRKLGPIMNDFSDEDIVNLANQNLGVVAASKKLEAKDDVEKITAGLKRMQALKEEGRKEDARLVLKSILSILSEYGIFLPGYNFDKPDSYWEYAGEKIEDGIEVIKAKTGN